MLINGARPEFPRLAHWQHVPGDRNVDMPYVQVVPTARRTHIAGTRRARMAHCSPTAQVNLYRREHYQTRIFRPAVHAAGLPEGTGTRDLRQALDSNKSGGFLARGDTAQTAAD